MKLLLLKVDRVASVDEARTLAGLGVREMTFTPYGLVGGPEDGRNVTDQAARQMIPGTPAVRWGTFIPGGLLNPADVHSLLLPGVRFVQSGHLDLAQGVTRVAGLEFVASDISADHDEDPAWTEASLEEACQAGATGCVVRMYPTVRDGWAIATGPDNAFDELKESDLRPLATRFPLLVEADFRPEHLDGLRAGPYPGVNLTLPPWQQTFRAVSQLLHAYRQRFGAWPTASPRTRPSTPRRVPGRWDPARTCRGKP